MIHHKRNNSGFTLVEMMLAMSFIGALLLAIAVTSIHIMNTYTKGLTIREVNQVGRTISEDIQRTIATTSPFIVIPAKTDALSDASNSKYVSRPGGGRLCVGAYTYAWNYGDTREISGATSEQVYNTYSDSDDVIRLVKVKDSGGVLCADVGRQIEKAQTKDLLVAGDRNLAVHQFTVSSHAQDLVSGQALYAISLVLGTNDQAQLDSAQASCLPPTEGSGFEQFCAINQFNIIARAGNRSGSL